MHASNIIEPLSNYISLMPINYIMKNIQALKCSDKSDIIVEYFDYQPFDTCIASMQYRRKSTTTLPKYDFHSTQICNHSMNTER